MISYDVAKKIDTGKALPHAIIVVAEADLGEEHQYTICWMTWRVLVHCGMYDVAPPNAVVVVAEADLGEELRGGVRAVRVCRYAAAQLVPGAREKLACVPCQCNTGSEYIELCCLTSVMRGVYL
jgi:hypothetical protein